MTPPFGLLLVLLLLLLLSNPRQTKGKRYPLAPPLRAVADPLGKLLIEITTLRRKTKKSELVCRTRAIDRWTVVTTGKKKKKRKRGYAVFAACAYVSLCVASPFLFLQTIIIFWLQISFFFRLGLDEEKEEDWCNKSLPPSGRQTFELYAHQLENEKEREVAKRKEKT